MGTSVPLQPVWDDDSRGVHAERTVWRWACEQLPDRIRVLPNVAMTLKRDGRPDEVEIDLLLIDPEHGITAVEVKGGTVGYDGNHRRWTGVHRDPVPQAKTARSKLRPALRQANVDPEAVALRWAVATPDCRLDAPGEPILPDEQLWDALAAGQLHLLHQRVCGQLTLGEQPLGEDRADWLARFFSGRTREGRAVLSTAVEDHERSVQVHTTSHRDALRRIWQHPHVLVRGAAGTGKTVLAVQAAVTFASQGERVLLTCWNVVLAHWLRERMQAELAALDMDPDLVTDDPTGQVVVSHVVGLARHGLDGDPDDPDLDADRDEVHHWFHEVLPDALTPATTDGPFDVVVLDEAQDLSDEWVWSVAELVRKGGRWYAFSDRQQDLFSQTSELAELLEHPHPLAENFRNSRQVAAFAGQFGEISIDCVTGDGPPVGHVACPTDRVEARAVEVARRLVRDEGLDAADVAVLYLFANPYRGRTDEVARMARTGELVVTNSASFKGMERPAVVVGLDLDPAKTDRVDEVRRAIYTAATRARSHLTVVGDPDVAEAYGFSELAAGLHDERVGAAS